MVFNWKLPGLYPVPAQDAGEELGRIYQEHGKMDAADVVDESRPEDAVLHPCFEWNDPVAAELWRQQQARSIINCIVVSQDDPNEKEPVKVRAFVHVQDTYHPMEVVVQDIDKYQELVAKALGEFRACAKKHSVLSNRPELQAIFSAIYAATA